MKALVASFAAKFGYRYIRTGHQRQLEFLIFGYRGRIMYTPRFDKRGDGTRAVFLAAIDVKSTDYSFMLQHYREGFDFQKHKDGAAENMVLTFLLRRPKEGGEFFVEGPMRSWLNNRIVLFDGGEYKHGVTKITKGSRTVLMFQRCR